MSKAADAIIALYRRHAAAWTQARGTGLPEQQWLDRMVALVDPPAELLDLGCGSGIPIAAYLSGRGYPVTGVDSAPEMIAMFAANLPAHKALVADMRTLRLDTRFGGIIAWDSFFHLTPDDQRAMFAVFRAHSLSGAALLFSSGPAFGEAIGMLEGEPLYHASLDGEEYRSLLDASGFELIAHIREDPTCGGRTAWLARKT